MGRKLTSLGYVNSWSYTLHPRLECKSYPRLEYKSYPRLEYKSYTRLDEQLIYEMLTSIAIDRIEERIISD